jgi:c-di-GMP-binding flagellar brake protein YcgR
MTWEGLNRRKFPRANFPCLIKVLHEGDPQDTLLTHTENISVGGACVILKKSVDLFSPVDIEFDLMDGGDIIACRGKVVWSVRRKAIESEKPSWYDLGLEFMDITPESRARVGQAVEHLVRGRRETSAH